MRPIISADELAARLDDPGLRLCDVRWILGRPDAGRAAYEAGHLPGAIFIDLDTVLAAPPAEGRHPLPDPVSFAEHLGRLGIGTDDTVVAYDDGNGSIAARLWWMLDSLGHQDVAVLDGGVAAWVASGRPLSTEAIVLPQTHLDLLPTWRRTIDRHALRRALAETVAPIRLLDVRAAERYRGEIEPIDPVAGHIPGAVSAPFVGNVDERDRFLPPADLAARYGALLAGRGEVAVQCGSGVNACHAALAMRIAGLPDPLLYAGSYSDWSRAGWPVATGPDPGEPLGPEVGSDESARSVSASDPENT